MRPQIVHKKALLWRVIKFFFPSYNWETTAMIFGKKIYVKNEISGNFLEHESTHVRQHKYSRFIGTIWWIRYILSKKFRYGQELEAYRNQYRFLMKERQGGHYKATVLKAIASDLSGPLYGSIATYEQAVKDITHGAI